MRMLFILWQVNDGCERGLRGVEHLLCTLLCTSLSGAVISQNATMWLGGIPAARGWQRGSRL